ncbi:MAG: hypothetical protein QI223_07170, partial [Candidatus Korarchaeota archaeon]|nr:hypothetical protein [Candidatus Korarchaeota archaeon]
RGQPAHPSAAIEVEVDLPSDEAHRRQWALQAKAVSGNYAIFFPARMRRRDESDEELVQRIRRAGVPRGVSLYLWWWRDGHLATRRLA